ncbi:unnamed protein product, partial [Mesorhabditis spiculigera]
MLWGTLFPGFSTAFIFGSTQEQDFCYQLDLENCFREIFMAVMLPPDRRVREVPQLFGNMSRGQSGLRNLMLCHDVRRIALCFTFPGCSDEMAAHVAAVQYHMVFGKKLPIQVFLSYRGFGKLVCEQGCHQHSLAMCKQQMADSRQDDQSKMLNLVQLADAVAQTRDAEGCRQFKGALQSVLRDRAKVCGEAAKCTCMEPGLQPGLSHCHAGCEHLLQIPANHSTYPGIILSFVAFISTLLLQQLQFYA